MNKNVAVREIVRVEFIPEQPEVNSYLYKAKGQTQLVKSGYFWWKKVELVTENVWKARDVSLYPFKLSDLMYCLDIKYSKIFREDLKNGILVRKCVVEEYDTIGKVVKSTIFDSTEEGVKYYNEVIEKWNLKKIR